MFISIWSCSGLCSILSVLVHVCVQYYLVQCWFVFSSIWSSGGLCSVVSVVCVKKYNNV